MGVALLVLVCLVSLFIIPLGLPGVWVMVLAGVVYSAVVAGSIGWVTLVGVALIGFVAEVLEFTLSAGYTRKYGGSRRAAWGAIVGGLVGAIIGFPVPIVGPIIAGFIGAFLGALAAEFSRGSSAEASTRAATGAVIGKAVAAALKVAAGVVIAAWLVLAALA